MQCDCESIYCEEHNKHIAGSCTEPPAYKVRIFGMLMNVCSLCFDALVNSGVVIESKENITRY